jgi:hypothetical protein
MPGDILPRPFDGCEHRSFLWQGSDCAALLIHGFPGTPAEMRPLGTVLKDAGWTVHGLMLPGLGADIESLDKRRRAGLAGGSKTSRRKVEATPLADPPGRLFHGSSLGIAHSAGTASEWTGSVRALLEFRTGLAESLVAGGEVVLSSHQTIEARRFLHV